MTVLVWMLVISVLLFKESYRLRYRPGLEWLQILFDQRRYGGLYAWQFPANFLVLRVASFLLDALWAVEHQERLARRKVTKLGLQQAVLCDINVIGSLLSVLKNPNPNPNPNSNRQL